MYFNGTVHVGQLADYLQFDHQIQVHGGIDQMDAIPLGFVEFAALWNQGVTDTDPRRISTVSFPDDALSSDSPTVDISLSPVDVSDFFITPDQIGRRPPPNERTPSRSDDSSFENRVVHEFAAVMLEQRTNSHRGYQRRKAKRVQRQHQAFESGSATSSLSPLQFRSRRPRPHPYTKSSDSTATSTAGPSLSRNETSPSTSEHAPMETTN